MTEEAKAAKAYLLNEVPQLLKNLEEGVQPVWGLMTAQHMLEHLIVVFKMALGRVKLPVITPPEKLDRARGFLISEGPMRRSVPSPIGRDELQPLRFVSLEAAREKLILEIGGYIRFTGENPDFVANHPYGGPMSTEDWLRFHKKHFIHHFTQFRLIPEDA